MKFLVAFFIVACIAIAQAGVLKEETKAKVCAYKKECIESTKVDPDVVKKSKAGEFSDDPKLKDFLVCFYKKAGFMNEAGEFQPEVAREKIAEELGKEVAEKVIKHCGDKIHKTPEETAFAISKCYHDNKPHKHE